MNRITCLACLVLGISFGCASTDTTSDVPQRTAGLSSGKSDNGGSCQGYCGELAPADCWCDDQCAEFGDCCEDKVAVCDSSCASLCDHRQGCFNRVACNEYCTTESPSWSETELDAFAACAADDPLCYQKPEDCMSWQLNKQCVDACEHRVGCFAAPYCTSYCQTNIASWSNATYEVFVACAATDPLCYHSIDDCIGVP